MENYILISIIAAVIGLIVGFIIGKINSSEKKHLQTKQKLDDLQFYTNSHFQETEKLLNECLYSFKQLQEHIDKNKQSMVADVVQSLPKPAEKPLDYAPKPENEVGTLDEKFGIEMDKAK